MKTVWKKRRLSSTEEMEQKLMDAIRKRKKEKVITLLDRLCRTGAHQTFAACAAREFLRNIDAPQNRR